MGNSKKNGNKKNKNWLQFLILAGITVLLLGVFTWGLSKKAGAFGDYNDYDYDTGGGSDLG